jgi:non-specific serine/threonine protein kinase
MNDCWPCFPPRQLRRRRQRLHQRARTKRGLFSPLRLTAQEAYAFLREVSLCEQCGIVCRSPNWWKRQSQTAHLNITVGERPPSLLDLNALLDFQASANLNDVELIREELGKC